MISWVDELQITLMPFGEVPLRLITLTEGRCKKKYIMIGRFSRNLQPRIVMFFISARQQEPGVKKQD